MSRWMVPVLGAFAIALVILTLLSSVSRSELYTGSQPIGTLALATLPPNVVLTEQQAIERAISEARRLGLQGEPWGVGARLMTLLEAIRLTGGEMIETPGVGAQFGREPTTPVWFVVIRGRIDMSGKAPGAGPGSVYDQMYLGLSAIDGKVIQEGPMPPNSPLLIPVPITPGVAPDLPVATPRPTRSVPLVAVTEALPAPPGSTLSVTLVPQPTRTPTLSPTSTPTPLPAYPQPTTRP